LERGGWGQLGAERDSTFLPEVKSGKEGSGHYAKKKGMATMITEKKVQETVRRARIPGGEEGIANDI